MSDNQFHSSKRQEAVKRLAADLGQLNTSDVSGTMEDEEMLSLMIEEARQGIDLAERYPSFYQKLLNNPDLRQDFLDILESTEEEDLPIPWAEGGDTNLSFLAEFSRQPVIAKLGDHWRISWQRNKDQLQAIFFPFKLAYRSDFTPSEDLWFGLLREEIEFDDLLYTIALECTFSEESQNAFAAFLNVAITIGTKAPQPPFPVQLSLQWGTYSETLRITEEGRARFPDIPIDKVFDDERKKIDTELSLTLEAFP